MGNVCCYKSRSDTTVEISAYIPEKQKYSTSFSNCPLEDELKFQRLVLTSEESLNNHYMILSALGSSKYNTTYKAIHKRSKSLHAIKSVLEPNYAVSGLQDEVNTLRVLDHPNIIQINEVIKDGPEVHVVMELCTGGNLLDRISDSHYFTENQAASHMNQLLAGVLYCHQQGIVCKGLRPENLMFLTEHQDSTLKITSFAKIEADEFTAPEGFAGEPSDIYSCGAILCTMVTGTPHPSPSSKAWNKISKSAQKLIEDMMDENPHQRPTAADVFAYKWMRKRNLEKDKKVLRRSLIKISQFKAIRRLRLEIIKFIAARTENLDENRSISRIFKEIDTNGDGKISVQELSNALEMANLQKSSIEEIVKSCDADCNGFIEYSEFIAVATDWQTLLSNERLESAFQIFDADGNGKISYSELQSIFGGEGNLWEQLVNTIDVNGDGEVDLQEFKNFMVGIELNS